MGPGVDEEGSAGYLAGGMEVARSQHGGDIGFGGDIVQRFEHLKDSARALASEQSAWM